MHPKDAIHDTECQFMLSLITIHAPKVQFIVCVCKPWHVRHNLHANLFAIHDTKCQFILSKIIIHDAQASIHFTYYIFAGVAQSVVHLIRNQKVTCSSHATSSKKATVSVAFLYSSFYTLFMRDKILRRCDA